MKKRTIASDQQIKQMQAGIAQHWIRFSYSCLPPNKTNVLVRVRISKKEFHTYTCRFNYDVEDCVQIGTSWPVPLNKAKIHGVVAWMVIPK